MRQRLFIRSVDVIGAINAGANLLSAGSSAVSVGSGIKSYKKIADIIAKQDEFNEYAAQRNYKRTRELIDEARQYESPSAVRARYEAAGMNPQLGMENGAGSSAALLTPAASDGVSIPDSGYGYSGNPSAIAAAGKGISNSLKDYLTIQKQAVENKYIEIEKQLGVERLGFLNELTQEEIIGTRTRNDIAKETLKQEEVNTSVAQGTQEARIDNLIKLNHQLDAAISEINSRRDLNDQSKNESIARISLMRTQENVNAAAAVFYGAQTEEVRANTRQILFDLGLSEETRPYTINIKKVESLLSDERLTQEQLNSLKTLYETIQEGLEANDLPNEINRRQERHESEMKTNKAHRRLDTAKTVQTYVSAIEGVGKAFNQGIRVAKNVKAFSSYKFY